MVKKKTTPKKKTAKKKVEKKTKEPKKKKTKKAVDYLEAVGRRKTSIARVRIFPKGDKSISVNGKTFENYFPTFELRETVLSPLKLVDCLDQFGISIRVKGGGISSQAEAVRHGIAKGLVLFNPEFRKKLKKAKYLTRDPRMRERKKFGLKRARRAPQWQKR